MAGRRLLRFVGSIALGLLFIAPWSGPAVFARGSQAHGLLAVGVPVRGLPSHGAFTLVEDFLGGTLWVVGPGRRLWTLVRTPGGRRAEHPVRLPPGRVRPWTDGRLAVLGRRRLFWVTAAGKLLPRGMRMPTGWHWVDGPGIQIRVGRVVEDLTPANTWRTQSRLPRARGQLLAVGVDAPWTEHGTDPPNAPVWAAWRDGRGLRVATFTDPSGWRFRTFPIGASERVQATGDTLLVRDRPVTLLTVAPTDNLLSETVYQGQAHALLSSSSLFFTTDRGGQILAWPYGFYPVYSRPWFRLRGRALSDDGEAVLYRAPDGRLWIFGYGGPFPTTDGPGASGPPVGGRAVHTAPPESLIYQVGSRWVTVEGTTITVGGRTYQTGSGRVAVDTEHLWLLTPQAIWSLGRRGPPVRVSWPARFRHPRYRMADGAYTWAVRGQRLYVALGLAVHATVGDVNPAEPLVRVTLIRVDDNALTVLATYPHPTGWVTSLAVSGETVWTAIYTGQHRPAGQLLNGRGTIVRWSLRSHRWTRVRLPRFVTRPDSAYSLRGETIVHLLAWGTRLAFLVQADPEGTEMGMGSDVWLWHAGRLAMVDLPAYPYLDVPIALCAGPDGSVVVEGIAGTWLDVNRDGMPAYLRLSGSWVPLTEDLGNGHYLTDNEGTHETTAAVITVARRRVTLLKQVVHAAR